MGFWDRFKKKAVPMGIVPNWLADKPVWSAWNTDTAIREGYKSVAWVYACVKLRANAVASVPIVVERYIGGEWVPDERHPLQRLINYPNPDLDCNELMRLFVTHLDLSGNAYQLKTRLNDSGAPLEIYPLMPQYVKIIPGKERLIAAYEYTQYGRTVYDGADVVHCGLTNPDSLYYGMSPLEAAGKAVDVDNAAASWQKISMQNRGVPDGVFSFDADLSLEQWEEARQMVREQYSGISHSRSPWVLSKAKYQQLSMSPAELDFMKTREFSMEQICAVYGIPREMISGMGDANRASGENVRRTFWLDTIVPLLSEIESALNLTLAREFGTLDQIRIKFDTSSVPALQENYTEKVANANNLWRMGVPFNQINERLELGFDEIEGGDIGYLPSGVIPSSLDFDDTPPSQAGAQAFGNEQS
jgi:HK97 family phage portal protein